MENYTSDSETVWNRTKKEIKGTLPNHAFNTWLDPINYIGMNNNELLLEVPNQFFYEWINSHYSKPIENIVRKLSDSSLSVKYTISPRPNDEINPNEAEYYITKENEQLKRQPPPRLNSKYTFKSFIEGASNQFAKAACLNVAESPGKQSFNPLIIYGGVGLGKTHLIHALGSHLIAERPDLLVVCASSEKFTLDFITSIQKNRTVEFSKAYRKADVLLIDDIQFFQGKEQTQEQFFHTFNDLYHKGKQIVLTADKYPGDMLGLKERLLSRFKSGLAVDIQPPDFETRVAILMDKAEQNGLDLPFDMIEFMATHLKNNVRELESTIIRILAHSSLSNREVDFTLVKETVKERLGDKPLNEVTVEDITSRVSEVTKISSGDIISSSRRKPVAEARQVAIFLCREILGTSLVSLGLHFGGRDHSTVIYACNKVEKMVEEDERMKSLVGGLKKEFSFALN